MKTMNQVQTDNPQKQGNQRVEKKKTDIKFNSAIFFQLGLVVALVAAAWAMNLKIGERLPVTPQEPGYTVVEPVFHNYQIEQKVVPVKQTIAKLDPQPTKRVVTSVFKEVPDDTNLPETKTVATITAPTAPDVPVMVPPAPPVADPPKKNTGPKNVISVEFVPIYPGCETAGNKDAKIACLSEKIGRFVGKKFDTSVAGYDIRGIQKITVQFKIDKNGNVADIVARAPDKTLEKEAQRVINKLPQFTPGRMGDVPVDVMYVLPIKFKVN